MEPLEMFLRIMATMLNIGTLSYVIWPDNRAYAFNEAWFIGGSAAYSLFSVINTLKSQAFDPIVAGELLIIIPVVLGITSFLRLTKYRWTARYAVSIMSGVGLGVTIGMSIRAEILVAIQQTAGLMVVGVQDYFWGSLMLVIFLTAITYYMYSNIYSHSIHLGRFSPIMKLGRIFLYLMFGYLYGWIAVLNGIGTLSSHMVTYYRVTITEVLLFLKAYGSGLTLQLLAAGISIPVAVWIIHYWYTEKYQLRAAATASM